MNHSFDREVHHIFEMMSYNKAFIHSVTGSALKVQQQKRAVIAAAV
jgi:hypothetical protein